VYSNDITLIELFRLMTAEAAEINFTKLISLIFNALLSTVKEFFAVLDKQMEAFTQSFLTELQQYLCSTLDVFQTSAAA